MMNGKKRNIVIAISGVVFAILLLTGISLLRLEKYANKEKVGITEENKKQEETSKESEDELWVDGTFEEDDSAQTKSEAMNSKPSSGSTDDTWTGIVEEGTTKEESAKDNKKPSQSNKPEKEEKPSDEKEKEENSGDELEKEEMPDEELEEEPSDDKDEYLPIIPPEYD